MKAFPFNFLKNLPDACDAEKSELLFQSSAIRIERIVSEGQKSPPDFYYQQEEDEWVYIVEGSATLYLKDENKFISLEKGNLFYLPAHQLHRIEKTSSKQKTIWLAIFCKVAKS